MKTLNFKEVVVAAAKKVANAIAVEIPRRRKSADAAAELRRRAEINARGASRRNDLESAIFGRGAGRWIEPRPDWMGRQ